MKKYWKEMDQSLFTIKNIGTFAVEMFKIKYNIFPETVSDIFLAETGYYYNFRQQNDFLYLPYEHYIIKVKTNLT